MELDNKVTMSVSSWTNYKDDEDIEFAIGTVDFLSTRPNSHKHIYSEEVLKKYAPTVLGKWVVAEFDKWANDVKGHTNAQKIVGRVPESQEVKYRVAEDGYIVASVDVIISKLYATDVYELFKKNNYRAVSIEELVGFTDETKDLIDGSEDKVVEGFNIVGITILGMKYNPSVPNMNIKITRMSDEYINDIETEYTKYSERRDNSLEKIDRVLEKLESIEQKLNKEEVMADLEEAKEAVLNSEEVVETEEVVVENSEEVVENAEAEVEEVVENAECEEDTKEEEVENACGDKEEEIENACEDAEVEVENECNATAMSELQDKLAEAEAKIETYEAELTNLRNFKKDVEYKEKMDIANDTLSKVRDYMDLKQYEDYIQSFENCEYENVNSLRNEILAKYFDQIKTATMSAVEEDTEIVDMGVPVESTNKVNSPYN